MTRGQRVIVVDGVPETAQVLREVFEPRGHRVDRIRGYELTRSTGVHDGVLVIHEDGSGDLQKNGSEPGDRRIVIASLTSETADIELKDGRQLSQPFHYAELVAAVESLLAPETAARSAA